MESLRDIGYELPSAVADLVDNSLDADATQVEITVGFEGADSWIRIADDGTGMLTSRMNEAMRYGSAREYDASDLGKFGLGLKTASLSQCRRLTVATRTNSDRREIEIRRWDLEHVQEEDRWELLRLSTREARDELLEPLRERVGTVVMWERLDRVLSYRLPSGMAAENGLIALCREIEEHLAMVFHRFLAGRASRPLPFTILVNGNPVEPWDPYAADEPATQRLDRQTITLRHEGRSLPIRVQPYILPNQMQFSSQHAWEEAAGPKKWNRQQGFYIYRGDRMIQSGGWNRLRTPDEHTKLARVAVDIPPAADAAFEVNVSKMRLLIPGSIRPDLKALASAVASRAQSAYRQSGDGGHAPSRGSGAAAATARPGEAPPASASQRTGANGTVSGAHPAAGSMTVGDVLRVLERELSDQPDVLARILRALGVRGAEDAGRAASA
jgi:hypothetical protein